MKLSALQQKVLNRPAVNKLVENVKNIEALIAAQLIDIDYSYRTVHLHSFCWHEKDKAFKTNYVHSLSQYMIMKSDGKDLPFTIFNLENKKIGEYISSGVVRIY